MCGRKKRKDAIVIVYVWVGVNVVRWCAYDHHNSALGCAHRCAGASVRLGCAHEYWLWKERSVLLRKRSFFTLLVIKEKKQLTIVEALYSCQKWLQAAP